MKQVYIRKTKWTAYFKDSHIMVSQSIISRYNYGEMPKDQTEEHSNEETAFDEILDRMGFNKEFRGKRKLFSKKIYFDDYMIFQKRIYKDELLGFNINTSYEPVPNPSVERLRKELNFNEYSELIFQREKTLRTLELENV